MSLFKPVDSGPFEPGFWALDFGIIETTGSVPKQALACCLTDAVGIRIVLHAVRRMVAVIVGDLGIQVHSYS